MAKATATIHGAVSIVNAIANHKGATLGIGLKVTATVQSIPGSGGGGGGISIQSNDRSHSSRLISSTVEKVVPKRDLEHNRIAVTLDSEIPTGYGLKSSSAISSAVALACSKIFKPHLIDRQVLLAGVAASIESKVSITGAYDDVCSCYYGGFNVTDNAKNKRVQFEKISPDLTVIIFVPKSRKRGNLKKLKILSSVFETAWQLAKDKNYWDAMTINGLATATILNSDPKIIADLIQKGALGASISGNGPSIAAVAKKENVSDIKKVFSALPGGIIVSKVNNTKAQVHEV